ncbi:MAG TPA: multiheme c-type cytochrome [Bryobacteraceae bacterium]|nr:multiheme c-type cytochrome [Bryobacteraceae bacterium]
MRQDSVAASGLRTGWGSLAAKISSAILLFETITGLIVTLSPFGATVQWSLLIHTGVGVLTLAPLCWYFAIHWADYRRQAWSDVLLLGYIGVTALLVCCVSGLVVTWQGLFGIRTSSVWRNIHLISTIAAVVPTGTHLVLAWLRRRAARAGGEGATGWAVQSAAWGLVPLLILPALVLFAPETKYVNAFPSNYNFLYGKDKPFAPSLARTGTGGAYDARSLAGSESCGDSGCHTQIVEEWRPSAHRYSAMDPVFQTIQNVMAKQNGPESTRYCGGCHDPISLFSGTKNIFVEKLTGLHGYNEGVSCLACHSIQKTDIQGNANYLIVQPRAYLWQWTKDHSAAAVARNFLIRTYPAEHNRLSKRMFKKPEYCAACHKQFIDQVVNRVGWVQLQNQYDNWAASHWNKKGDARGTVECRECHMPLVDSTDPAAGDAADYNRRPTDRKHRSHRFLAANNMMPALLKLPGGAKHVELTNRWLQGHLEIPEIRGKWAEGPVVRARIEAPDAVAPGERFPFRVVLTSNKVGHDYPTGPLDMIQSWLEVRVADDRGNVVFASGRRDAKGYLEPGTFLFKAEPVDQYGNLIDRHNLWEMVGVRYRRSLFPGYSDTVEYQVACPSTAVPARASKPEQFELRAAPSASAYTITAALNYRKIDQFLLDYVLGQKHGLTAPPVEITRATATVAVRSRD